MYLLGRLNVTASTTGENAMGGTGGNGDGGGDDRDYNPGSGGGETWEMYGGPAGGGGGGGGTAAPAIGCGGAGGSGGGGGATGASDDGNSWDTATWPYTCPGGSGGGGGWPNGGGGGGGGQTNANRIVYNKSLGGAGGAGGKENGVVGYPGYIDVNHGESIDFNYCGYAGNGAGGLDSGAASAGDRTYSNGLIIGDPNPYGGQGGAGGGPVAAREWTSADSLPVLVLSTAGNYDLSVAADLDYAYGAGSGSGADSRKAAEARVVYEVEDLSYDPTSAPEDSYTYTGSPFYPEVTFGDTASYTAASDRDDALVPGASEVTIPVTTTGEMRYGENIHCPEGTVTYDATGLTAREDLLERIADTSNDDPILVGSQITWRFAINKATLTSVPLTSSVDPGEAQVGVPMTLSLDKYEFKDGIGSLSDLWLDTQGTTGAPTVTWSVITGEGTFSDDTGLETTFTPSAIGEIELKATITGMNDFEDYEVTLTLPDVKVGNATADIAFDLEGEAARYGDEVPFTVTGAGESATVEVTGEATLKDYDSAAGKGTLVCTGAGAAMVKAARPESANWTAAEGSEELVIAPRGIEAEWVGTEARPYDGAASTVAATFSDPVFLEDFENDEVGYQITGGSAVLGGTHTATVSLFGDRAEDYTVENPTAEYTIAPAASTAMLAKVLNEDGTQEIGQATYGDAIIIEATIAPSEGDTGMVTNALADAMRAGSMPTAELFTFSVDDEDLDAEEVEVTQGTGGSFIVRFTLDTATRQLQIGENDIAVVFAGDANLPAASATCSLVLERAPLSLALAAVDGKPYDATTDVTGIEFELAGVVGDDKPEVTWDEAAWVAADPGTDTVRLAGIALDGDSDAWYDLDDDIEASGIEGQPANGATIRTADVTVAVELEGKVYDGEPVGEPTVAVVGEAGTQSTGDVTVTWFASDGQGGWVEIEGAPVDAGDYRVEATAEADGNHNASAEPGFALFTIERAPQDAPEGVTSTDETEPGASDGTISGLPAGSEWRPVGGTWADAPEGGVVSGLAPGAYEVRMKGDANHEPSDAVTVRVGAASALAGIFGSIGGASGDAQGGIPGTGDPAAIAGVLAAAGATALAVGAARRRR